MRLPEFARTTAFRWALAVSAAFALCTLLMFAFLLFETVRYIEGNFDTLISGVLEHIERGNSEDQIVHTLQEHLKDDPRRVKIAALFNADDHLLAGNVETLPSDMHVGAGPQYVRLTRVDALGTERQLFRATARHLPNGDTLVVGRDISELLRLAQIVKNTLALGLIPALGLSLAAGVFLSMRWQRRLESLNSTVQRIMAGELRERLPTRGSKGSFDRLASSVNKMLDEIETLVKSLAAVGDDIAHDLRTPLTRLRIGLERGRQNAQTADELRLVVDQAIIRLDQSLNMTTALLRISEIEHSRRLDGFRKIALDDMVREVADLYEPIAEDKNVAFAIEIQKQIYIQGDRDLLFEAVANLVDNAVKFTPEGGRVQLSTSEREGEAVIQVTDTGPGIPDGDEEFLTRRFYRSDKSRTEPGFGLGLSLVNAIAKLHGFKLCFSAGPGCVAEMSGPLQRA